MKVNFNQSLEGLKSFGEDILRFWVFLASFAPRRVSLARGSTKLTILNLSKEDPEFVEGRLERVKRAGVRLLFTLDRIMMIQATGFRVIAVALPGMTIA